MATLSHAVAAWFNDGSIDLGEHIVRAFQEVRGLSSSSPELEKPNGKGLSPQERRYNPAGSGQRSHDSGVCRSRHL